MHISISDELYSNFSQLLFDKTGVALGSGKKAMMTARLRKRLRTLNVDNFESYFSIITHKKDGKVELQHFIDSMTTHETYFFRESVHFDFIKQFIIPTLSRQSNHYKIWSAACSSGEEPYTLAMVMAEYWGLHKPWEILGTDIAIRELESAKAGIYTEVRARHVPLAFKKKYMLKGIEELDGFSMMQEDIKKKVNFDQFNLIDSPIQSDNFDLVMCRNVLIYFNKETQEHVIRRLLSAVKPGGFFMVGRSEHLRTFALKIPGIKMVNNSIVQKELL